MTGDSAPAMRPKLSFRRTFREAFSQVFGQFRSLAKLALLPMILSLGISAIVFAMTTADPENQLLRYKTTPLHALGLVPFAIFGVACCQRFFAGKQSGFISLLAVGRRTLIWCIYSIPFLLALGLPILILVALPLLYFFFASPGYMFVLVAEIQLRLLMPWQFLRFISGNSDALSLISFFPHHGSFGNLFGNYSLWVWPPFLLLISLLARFSLVFPAVGTGEKLGLAGSWRLTKKSGLKLFAVLSMIGAFSTAIRTFFLFAIYKVFRLIFSVFDFLPSLNKEFHGLLIKAPVHIGEFAVIYLCIAVVCAALCSAYAQLRGWDGQAPDPSETKNPGARPA